MGRWGDGETRGQGDAVDGVDAVDAVDAVDGVDGVVKQRARCSHYSGGSNS